jgi:hypothetical protein
LTLYNLQSYPQLFILRPGEKDRGQAGHPGAGRASIINNLLEHGIKYQELKPMSSFEARPITLDPGGRIHNLVENPSVMKEAWPGKWCSIPP